MGKRVRVQRIPVESAQINKRETYATVCYYYPQYTLKEAAQLPFRDIRLLIATAQKIEAARMYNFTQIAAAPHTKKMENVGKLSDYFKKMAGM